MTYCMKCGADEEHLNAENVCLQCRAQEVVEDELRATGRGAEVLDVDAIIGANRRTCPSCNSNDKATRRYVSYARVCTDVWHERRASGGGGQ